MPQRAIVFLLALAGPLACTTTRTSEPAGMSQAQPLLTEAVRAWRLVDGAEVLGVVVQFSDPSSPDQPGRLFYSVRNPHEQELGSIDAQGRAWRFVPHQREAAWIGTGTLLEGARRILAASPAARLEETPLAELSAS